jgi:hypothetical protein
MTSTAQSAPPSSVRFRTKPVDGTMPPSAPAGQMSEVGVSRYAVRLAERVKDADPKLFEQVHAAVVPLRGAVKEIEHREAEKAQATLDRIDPEAR